MDRRRFGGRVLVGLAAIALVAGCAGNGPFASESSRAAIATPGSPPATAAPVTPSDWTRVTSPWLGYTIAMPGTWAFSDHVVAGDARSPHDVYTGAVDDATGQSTLVVGSCPSADVTASGPVTESMTVDGASFDIVASTGTDPGRTTLFATGVRGVRTWYVMAGMPDDAASRAVFRQVVVSFRFPDADFSAQPESASTR